MLAISGNSYFQTWLHYQQNALLAIQKKIYTQTVIVGNKTEITNCFLSVFTSSGFNKQYTIYWCSDTTYYSLNHQCTLTDNRTVIFTFSAIQ